MGEIDPFLGLYAPLCSTKEMVLKLGNRVLNMGNLSGWLGEWNGYSQRYDKAAPLILFKREDCRGDVSRLTMALNLMRVGAKFLERGGYVEEAARESLMLAETVSNYLWWALAIDRLLKLDCPSKGDKDKWDRAKALATGYKDLESDKSYWSYLLGVGIHALVKADHLFRQGRRQSEKRDAYLVVDKVPANAVTLACSLGMAAIKHGLPDSLQALEDLLVSWRGSEAEPKTVAGENGADKMSYFTDTLKDSLIRHSFPVMNRLQGLKILIDSAVISEKEPSGEILTWLKEWKTLGEKVNFPLHFTPLQSGTTCGLVYLCYHHFFTLRNEDPDDDSAWQVRATAHRHLLSSEQMSTMRRAFYENVSDLYYLYDDFNDRQLHFNHAMQMAGLEYVELLRFLLKAADELGSEPDASAPNAQASSPKSSAEPEKGPTPVGA